MHVGLIGGIRPAATDYYYRGLIRAMAARGLPLDLTIAHADAEALLLGGTDLFLAFDGQECGFPVIDCAALHIAALAQAAAIKEVNHGTNRL